MTDTVIWQSEPHHIECSSGCHPGFTASELSHVQSIHTECRLHQMNCNVATSQSVISTSTSASHSSIDTSPYRFLRPIKKTSCCCTSSSIYSMAVLFALIFLLITPELLLALPVIHSRGSASSSSAAAFASQAESSPSSSSKFSRDFKRKWENPCGLKQNTVHRLFKFLQHEKKPVSEEILLENIINSAKRALRHSRIFKEDYVLKTFRARNWRDHHETWRDIRYNWLPSWEEIPKHLHEKTKYYHLRKLEVEDTLRTLYRALQKLAVGLEQVVWDKNSNDGEFLEDFRDAEFRLKAVLCELQVAMLEKGMDPDEPVSRDIMGESVRNIDNDSYRNLRDWYIFRDYINSLEYVVHSFNHLKSKHKRSRKTIKHHRSHLA